MQFFSRLSHQKEHLGEKQKNAKITPLGNFTIIAKLKKKADDLNKIVQVQKPDKNFLADASLSAIQLSLRDARKKFPQKKKNPSLSAHRKIHRWRNKERNNLVHRRTLAL